jgi:hypothetical protein
MEIYMRDKTLLLVLTYQKKPIVVEVARLDADNLEGVVDWIGSAAVLTDAGLYIKTLEGPMKVREGNYIIKGVAGEFYPCDSEIFHRTYDPVVRPSRR